VGERLVRYYAFARARGGLALQIKLAVKTSMAEPRAAAAPDSPENLKKFHDALVTLVGQDPDLPKP
jgi:hypothetical protein